MRNSWILVVAVVALFTLTGLYWYATGGVPKPTDRLQWLDGKFIAHRGLFSMNGSSPENSLPAFRRAAEKGLPIELDVHLTSDGEIVVIHDDNVERMTGRDASVAELTLAQVQQLSLLGGSERIPTLKSVLAEIDGRVPLVVEVKNEGKVGALEDEVARTLKQYKGDVAVVSFNPFSLARVAKSAPEIPRGQLSGSFSGEDLAWYEKFLLRRMLMNWTSKPHFIAYEISELPSWGTSLQHNRGRALVAWTAEARATAENALGFADAVICDPAALSSDRSSD